MKLARNLITLAIALLSVAAVAVLVIRHFDEVMRPIHAMLKKFGVRKDPCCCDGTCDDEIFEVNAEE